MDKGFNRTFMELKCHYQIQGTGKQKVLIVPLWNWNEIIALKVIAAAEGFNRTFMELKLAYAAMRILYKITK